MHGDDLLQELEPLADADAADGVAGEVERDESAARAARAGPGTTPPCTMPKSAWSVRVCAAWQRSAQRKVRSQRLRRRAPRSAGYGGHSSKAMMMSAPSCVLDLDRALGRELDRRAVDLRCGSVRPRR